MVELVPQLLRQELESRSHREKKDGRSQWESRHIDLKLTVFTMQTECKGDLGDAMVYAV